MGTQASGYTDSVAISPPISMPTGRNACRSEGSQREPIGRRNPNRCRAATWRENHDTAS